MQICISGLTAVGKTSLADHLCRQYNCSKITGAARMLAILHARHVPKESQLLAWLQDSLAIKSPRLDNPQIDRQVDLYIFGQYSSTQQNLVFESLTLPWLAGIANDLLSILLVAPEDVRAQRLRQVMPFLSQQDARKIVRKKDELTRTAVARAWGIEGLNDDMSIFYDLVIENDESTKAKILTKTMLWELVQAVVEVYRGYQNNISSSEMGKRIDYFSRLREDCGDYIHRVSPLLLSRDAPYTPLRWRFRRSEEA